MITVRLHRTDHQVRSIPQPCGLNTLVVASGRKRFAGSMIGDIAETQTVIDYCFGHGISLSGDDLPRSDQYCF